MNFLREPDDLMHKMAHNQAALFADSVDDGLPSYAFVKMFMGHERTFDLDGLILVSGDEIYVPVRD